MRILAVADKAGWALEHHCRDLQAALARDCQIDVEVCPQDQPGRRRLITMATVGNYDCIYPTWHELSVASYQVVGPAVQRKILCGIHDFHTWDGQTSRGLQTADPSACAPELMSALKNFTGTVAICRSLQQAFCEVSPLLAYHGANTDIFHVLPGKRSRGRRLRVGWVGTLLNTKHNHGLFEAIREKTEGKAEFFEARVSQASDRPLTRSEMAEFYNSIDVLIVTSFSEGSPLPPIEGCGCGVPTISPPVGAMPEFIRDGLDGFIIDSYDPDPFVRKIQFLSENREALSVMRDQCLEKAAGPWNLLSRAPEWLAAFRRVADLAGVAEERNTSSEADPAS